MKRSWLELEEMVKSAGCGDVSWCYSSGKQDPRRYYQAPDGSVIAIHIKNMGAIAPAGATSNILKKLANPK